MPGCCPLSENYGLKTLHKPSLTFERACLADLFTVGLNKTTKLTFPVSAARSVGEGLCEDVRPKDDLSSGVSHHHLSGRLLCVGEFRGGQGEDEVKRDVNVSLSLLYYMFFFFYSIHKSTISASHKPVTSHLNYIFPQYLSRPIRNVHAGHFWAPTHQLRMPALKNMGPF